MEERRLICAAQKGDDTAFEELIGGYQTKIYSICLRFLCSEEDAKDAAQESMLKIYLSLRRYRFQSAFSTWVYAVARNTALDFCRKLKRHPETSLEVFPDCGENLAVQESQVEDAMEIKERWELLKKLLQELPEEQRKSLILKDVDGFSCEEIALICNCSVGTIKSRLHRARERFQKMLEESGV